MYYKQSINNIKVVILSLDGGLLDLNRLRFNYFKRICKNHNYEIKKEDFEKALGNMKTMYNGFDIAKDINPNEINELIEHDLFEYAKLKSGILKKEGVDELLQFFKQKNIKIAVISSHKTKNAIRYLQLTRLFNKVDFVIGADSDNLPLPDPSLLTTTLNQLDCKYEEAIVIANYPSLLEAANKIFANVIYLSDLCPAKESYFPRVFKTAKNNLEIINIFLFARYDSLEIYSPLLGMSSNMSIDALNETYHHLLNEYKNDQQLINLVNNTYHYFYQEITNRDNNNITMFEDDSISETDESPIDNNEIDLQNEAIIEEDNKDIEEINIIEKIKENNELESFSTNDTEQLDDEFSKTKTAINYDAKRLNELMDIINGSTETIDEKEDSQPVQEVTSVDEESSNNIGIHILNFIYTTLVVILVSFLAMIGYVGFIDFFESTNIIANYLNMFIEYYLNSVFLLSQFIFDKLNQLISSIPNYSTLIVGNELFSSLAIKFILATTFNLIIVYLFKLIVWLLTRSSDDE